MIASTIGSPAVTNVSRSFTNARACAPRSDALKSVRTRVRKNRMLLKNGMIEAPVMSAFPMCFSHASKTYPVSAATPASIARYTVSFPGKSSGR